MSAYRTVVGTGGLDGARGRLPGPVPADASRRPAGDVLVVRPTG